MTSKPPPIRACGACVWWAAGSYASSAGRCHFNPPRILAKTDQVWPHTYAEDFCKEFTPEVDEETPQ